MEHESRAATLKRIIYDIVSDGNPHSYGELQAAILEENPSLLPSSNVLSTALYRISKSDTRFRRIGKASYRFFPSPDGEEAPKGAPGATPSEGAGLPPKGWDIVNQVRVLLAALEQDLRQPDYEMSEAEFSACRKLYQLSREVQSVISKYV